MDQGGSISEGSTRQCHEHSLTHEPPLESTILSLRTRSLTLSAFPWKTDIIVRPSNLIEALQKNGTLKKNGILEVRLPFAYPLHLGNNCN